MKHTCTQPGKPLTPHPWIPLPRIPSGCREPRESVLEAGQSQHREVATPLDTRKRRRGFATGQDCPTPWASTLITSSQGWGHLSLRTRHTQPQLLAPGPFLGTMHQPCNMKGAGRSPGGRAKPPEDSGSMLVEGGPGAAKPSLLGPQNWLSSLPRSCLGAGEQGASSGPNPKGTGEGWGSLGRRLQRGLFPGKPRPKWWPVCFFDLFSGAQLEGEKRDGEGSRGEEERPVGSASPLPLNQDHSPSPISSPGLPDILAAS